MRDESVPYELSLKISDNVASEDVQIRFIKDGDHRLSTERDIAILKDTVAALCDSAA
jgi:esterase/lipase